MAKTVGFGVSCVLLIGVTFLSGATPALAEDCKKSLVMLDSIALTPMSDTDFQIGRHGIHQWPGSALPFDTAS